MTVVILLSLSSLKEIKPPPTNINPTSGETVGAINGKTFKFLRSICKTWLESPDGIKGKLSSSSASLCANKIFEKHKKLMMRNKSFFI